VTRGTAAGSLRRSKRKAHAGSHHRTNSRALAAAAMLLRTVFAYTRTRRYMQPAFVLKDVTCPRARTCAAIAVPRPSHRGVAARQRTQQGPVTASTTTKTAATTTTAATATTETAATTTVRACCCATTRKDMLCIIASEGRWEEGGATNNSARARACVRWRGVVACRATQTRQNTEAAANSQTAVRSFTVQLTVSKQQSYHCNTQPTSALRQCDKLSHCSQF